MKAKFIKDGKVFECFATEVNVKHLELHGWKRIPSAAEPEPVVAAPVETATMDEQPARRVGRPRKSE